LLVFHPSSLFPATLTGVQFKRSSLKIMSTPFI
jgi:hypothetical protein